MSKTEGFLRFWCARKCPEDCADDSFCYIRPFFRESKNHFLSQNRQKTSKIDGFLRFFHVRSNPLRESGCRVSKIEGFLPFCARICANDLFCYIRPLQTLSRGEKRWFQTTIAERLQGLERGAVFRRQN